MTIADQLEAGARARGEMTPELEAFIVELRSRERAGVPLVEPQVVPPPASAAQRRAHERRVDGGIPPGSQDPTRIQRRQRHRRRVVTELSEGYRRHLGELARRGARACRPAQVPGFVWGTVKAVQMDPSGGAGERLLASMPPAYRWDTLREATAGGRGLGHVQARTTISIAWFYLKMSRPTRRRGFALVSDAIPIGTVRAVVFNPMTGKPYSRSGLAATSWGKNRREDHHSGAMARLRRCGLLFRVQPPAGAVPLAFVGPSGYAFAQTWISVRALYGEPPDSAAQSPP